jgi:hypothetical protein
LLRAEYQGTSHDTNYLGKDTCLDSYHRSRIPAMVASIVGRISAIVTTIACTIPAMLAPLGSLYSNLWSRIPAMLVTTGVRIPQRHQPLGHGTETVDVRISAIVATIRSWTPAR